MQRSYARTDLASETFKYSGSTHCGINSQEFDFSGIRCELVSIINSEAAEILNKPIGDYYTLYLDRYLKRRSVCFNDAVFALSLVLKRFEEITSSHSFLIACLGNRLITPDALGPYVADSVLVTRHLGSSLSIENISFSDVSVFRTGVLGTTGIESADELRAICSFLKPDCVIAVDALASGDLTRICRNIQICNTGISPGSGVGNNRASLSYETLGIPVIAVGVPTVIDLQSLCSVETNSMFVTPRNIDELVKSSAKLIAYGINLALHDGISLSDLDMLIE